jgi:hypothetical protein
MAYLYRHIRLDNNEPFYIGIGSDNGYYRAKSLKRNIFWKRITSITNYEIEIMFEDISYEEACNKEKEFIKLYGRSINGGTLCNLTDGGEGTLGILRDENVRRNIGISSKKKWDIDLRKKQSINIKKRFENPLERKKIRDSVKRYLSENPDKRKINNEKMLKKCFEKTGLLNGIQKMNNGRYRLRITKNGIRKHIGVFITYEEAIENYKNYHI